MTVLVDLGGGPVSVTLVDLPVGEEDGLWVGCCPWLDQQEQWPVLPAFVATGPADLLGVALVVGGMRDADVAVMTPAGVPAARTALALAVGRLLWDQRAATWPSPVAVVTCGVRPPGRLGSGVVAVPHEVAVTTGTGLQVRVVWELVRSKRLPAWLDGLRHGTPSAVAAGMAA